MKRQKDIDERTERNEDDKDKNATVTMREDKEMMEEERPWRWRQNAWRWLKQKYDDDGEDEKMTKKEKWWKRER